VCMLALRGHPRETDPARTEKDAPVGPSLSPSFCDHNSPEGNAGPGAWLTIRKVVAPGANQMPPRGPDSEGGLTGGRGVGHSRRTLGGHMGNTRELSDTRRIADALLAIS